MTGAFIEFTASEVAPSDYAPGCTLASSSVYGPHIRPVLNKGKFANTAVIRLPIHHANQVVEWLVAQVICVHSRDSNDPTIFATSHQMRLSDGIADYWWDGADWVFPPGNEWNTEEEVGQGLASWGKQDLGIVLRLSTTDTKKAALFLTAKIIFTLPVDYDLLDDLWRNAFLPGVRSARAIGRARGEADGSDVMKWPPQDLSVNYVSPTPIAVFNHTKDPEHRFNLMASWLNDEIVLSEQQPDGDLLEVAFTWGANVSYTRDPDHYPTFGRDVGAHPSIHIERHTRREQVAENGSEPWALNIGTGNAWKLPGRRRTKVEFVLRFRCDKRYDLVRLAEAVRSWSIGIGYLTAPGSGLGFDLSSSFLRDFGLHNIDHSTECELTITLLNVAPFDHDLKPAPVVQALSVQQAGDVPSEIYKPLELEISE